MPSPLTGPATGYGSGAVPKSSYLDSGALEGRTGGLKADCPQAKPATGFTLHLPRPTSVNRGIKYLGNKSPGTVRWFTQCNRHIMMMRPKPKPVHGEFTIDVMIDKSWKRKVDLDNMIKRLLDYLERVELIDNDKLCDDIHMHWGAAHGGCVVTVRSVFL